MHLVDLDISVADAAPLWFEDIDADTTTVREEFYGNFFVQQKKESENDV